MSKIVNGVANDYEFDMPMYYEPKTKTNKFKNYETFTRWTDPTIKDLQQELDQYKNNWEELKKWLKEQDDEHQPYYNTYDYNGEYEEVLNKMKELEEGK